MKSNIAIIVSALILVHCSKNILRTSPSIDEEIIIAMYTNQLIEMVVNEDLQDLSTMIDSLNNKYIIESLEYHIMDKNDTLKVKYTNIDVLQAKTENSMPREILYYSGKVPKSGIVEVYLDRTFNENRQNINFKYQLNEGKIIIREP